MQVPEPGSTSDMLEVARSASRADSIRSRVREVILRGEFAPGEHLREIEIAARFEVSRGPVHEALLQLEQEGLVLLRRNRGAVVARLSRADLEEVYSLRLALERLAVARAVQHGTDTDFSELDAVLHEFRGTGSGQPLTEQVAADQDVRFHDGCTAPRTTTDSTLPGAPSAPRSTCCCSGAMSPDRIFAKTRTSGTWSSRI